MFLLLLRPSGQNLPTGRGRQWIIVGIVIGMIAGGGIVAGILAHVAPAQTGKLLLAQERAAARKAGLVLSEEALSAPMPPASENAAPLYQQFDVLDNARTAEKDPALQKLATADETVLDAERRNPRSLTSAEWGQVHQALSRRAPELTVLRKAIERPACVFGPHEYVLHLDPTDPGNETYERAQGTLRLAENLVVSDTMAAAHFGRLADALKAAIEARKIAQHAAFHHNLVGFVTAETLEATALSGFRFLLRSCGSDAKTCRSAGAAAGRPLPLPPLSEVLKVETASNQGMVDAIAANSLLSFASANGSFSRAEYGRMIDAFGAYQLNAMRRSIAAADEPYADCAPVLKAIAAESDAKYPKGGALPQPFMDWSQLAFTRDTLTNVERTTVAGASVLAWHCEHGKFPATLADAMPHPPTDAFDGKPLHYEVTATGFALSATHQRAGHKPEVAAFSYP